MKREYKKPLTEIVILNSGNYLQEYNEDPTQDSTGTITGSDPNITANESFFDEDGMKQSKALWDD